MSAAPHTRPGNVSAMQQHRHKSTQAAISITKLIAIKLIPYWYRWAQKRNSAQGSRCLGNGQSTLVATH